MRFEYDPRKSASKKDKHGLDFEAAQALWQDAGRIEIDARVAGERRVVTIGRIGGKLWAAIFTLRGDNIRLISVRRARDKETEWYDGNQGNRA